MPDLVRDFLLAAETHDPRALRATLDAGLELDVPLQGRTALQWLTSMYTRSARFAECAALLLDRGATLDDPALAPVLRDDAAALRAAVLANPALPAHRTDLDCAFTPLRGATLLHVAAEYQHARCVAVLLEAGVDVDARAATDSNGLNGHSALFHTVNAHADRAAAVRGLLLRAGARTDLRVAGITWGRGFEWETTWFDLTPVAYAQLGMTPQMHRDEHQVAATVQQLLAAGGRDAGPLPNIPNRYLKPPPG
jgi:hypothetical protein